MEWLEDLFWNPSSVAHIVFLYAFVIALGVYLGKVKIFGVSLVLRLFCLQELLLDTSALRVIRTSCISFGTSV